MHTVILPLKSFKGDGDCTEATPLGTTTFPHAPFSLQNFSDRDMGKISASLMLALS